MLDPRILTPGAAFHVRDHDNNNFIVTLTTPSPASSSYVTRSATSVTTNNDSDNDSDDDNNMLAVPQGSGPNTAPVLDPNLILPPNFSPGLDGLGRN